MKWHKISEELPPENKPVLFRKDGLTCLNDYSYLAGRFNVKYGHIYTYLSGHNSNIQVWPEWTEIEPPEEEKDKD